MYQDDIQMKGEKMKNGLKEENNRYLAGEVDEDYKIEDSKINEEDDEEEYYDLPQAIRKRTRLWSVIAFAAAIIAILLCHFYYVGFVFVIAAIVFAIISRRTLGYFDNMTVFGIIGGAVGIVFNICFMIGKIFNLF